MGIVVEEICGFRLGDDGERACERREERDMSADIFYGQVYAILDEVFLAGEIEETSKQVVLTRLEHLDKLE